MMVSASFPPLLTAANSPGVRIVDPLDSLTRASFLVEMPIVSPTCSGGIRCFFSVYVTGRKYKAARVGYCEEVTKRALMHPEISTYM